MSVCVVASGVARWSMSVCVCVVASGLARCLCWRLYRLNSLMNTVLDDKNSSKQARQVNTKDLKIMSNDRLAGKRSLGEGGAKRPCGVRCPWTIFYKFQSL